jgi:hypothetical protein
LVWTLTRPSMFLFPGTYQKLNFHFKNTNLTQLHRRQSLEGSWFEVILGQDISKTYQLNEPVKYGGMYLKSQLHGRYR